jgi:hypothetical protein
MASVSTITDGALWLMTESILVLALSMNREISLFALSEPWNTLVNVLMGLTAWDNWLFEFLFDDSWLLLLILDTIQDLPKTIMTDINYILVIKTIYIR